jgi:DNA polymerase elongation subunit (family B)
MIIDIENKGDSLKVSHYTEEGELAYLDLKIPQSERYNWRKCSAADRDREKGWASWDGFPVKKQPTQRYDKYRLVELLESFDKEQTQPLWDTQTAKKYFVDIEVEITDNRADSLDTLRANNKILTIAIASSTGKILVLGLDKMDSPKILKIEKRVNDHFKTLHYDLKWTFNYRSFESEFDMIYTFMSKLMHKMPLITGWNWFGYDWPYLLNRAKKLGIDPAICSPSGVLLGKDQIPMHGLMVDYLQIYKKWDRVIKIRESDSLAYVSNAALGVTKIHYNGTLKDLYESDFETYIFYNAIDSCLVHYIDVKLNTLATFFKIANVSGVEINRALSPVWTTEVLMLRKFNQRKRVIVYDRKDEEHTKFEGGYVKSPIKGLHEWVVCFDFASLYPNTMMQWGLSPEIFIGKNLTNPPEGAIKTAGGAYFHSKTGDEPVLRDVLTTLYTMRKSAKKKYLECETKIIELEELLKTK